MTIDVTDQFIVHAGETFAFTDETGFLLQGEAGPSLINAGAISLRVTAAAEPAAVPAVHATADNATVWNKAGGQISVSGSAGAGGVWAIYLEGASNLLRNAGDVLARGDSTCVVASGGQDLDIDNSGRLDARGAVDAVTLLLHTNNQIVNTGVISARADQATGLAVLAGPAGQLDNSGLIIARGGASACAVSIYFDEGGYQLTNSGHIVAVDAGGHSLAIYLQPHHDGAPASVIDNSGTIRADVALRVAAGFGDVVVDNSGKLIGEIDLGYGADQLVNAGLIRGDVDLAYGDDLYDGSDGRLVGSLMGGRGADTLTGGLDSDHFRYDQLIDSTLVSSDLITNLQSDDLIDLSRIDADPSHKGQQHLTAHEVTLTFDAASGNTWLDVDTGGADGPEMRIVIVGDHTDFTGVVL